MAEAKVTESEILKTVTRPDNPRGGTDFLTKQPKRNVLPNFFKLLHAGGPIQEKVAAIGNVRRALEEPDKSGLADNIIETTPDEFINRVIIEGSRVTSMTPSLQAQEALKAIKSNFGFAIENNRIVTLSGKSTEILVREVNPKFLLEAVASGIFSKTESLEFKKVLFKTFLRLSENPRFPDNVLSGIGKDWDEEKRKTKDKEEEKSKSTTEAESLRLEIARLTAMGRDKDLRLLDQQANIRELEKLLAETKRGSSSSMEFNFDPQIPPDWNRVLDVIPGAVPERIISNFRQRQRLFHPDTVLAPLETAGIRRDSPIYKAMLDFATRWKIAIDNAFEEAKRKGLVTNGNGK